MRYCTNCGKETNSKKICEHCGIKHNKKHAFCEWCGSPIDAHYRICPNCNEPKKTSSFVCNFFGIIFCVFNALASVAYIGKSNICAILFFMVALLLLPITKKQLQKLTHKNHGIRKKLYSIRIIAIVVLFFVGLFCTPVSEQTSSVGGSYTSRTVDMLTESEIERAVVNALYQEISEKYDNADPGSCKFEINKTEIKNGTLYVYGEVYLYDKYGKFTTGYRDGSGTPYRVFTVTIGDNCWVRSCDID